MGRFISAVETQCTGKHAFPTRSAADVAASKNARLHSYRCTWCGSFHVGGIRTEGKRPTPPPPEIDLSEVNL